MDIEGAFSSQLHRSQEAAEFETPPGISGRHLWDVAVTYAQVETSRSIETLIISTAARSIAIAVIETEAFLNRDRSTYIDPQINSITYAGQIDA